MTKTDFEVKYTLAFCILNGTVLMLKRRKPPNINLWNGLGGKIKSNETPIQSIQRELFEEAGLTVHLENSDYKGIVKWTILEDKKVGGAHLFLLNLKEGSLEQKNPTDDEGTLAWKSQQWLSDRSNTEIVENIPLFFPHAIRSNKPKVFEFTYKTSNQLLRYRIRDLKNVI